MTGAGDRPADDEAGREAAASIPEPRASGEPSPEPFLAFYQREYRGFVALAASLIGQTCTMAERTSPKMRCSSRADVGTT